MIVTFCGNREVHEPKKVKAWLEEVVDRLIRKGADIFYLGGYGQFDLLAASVVHEKKGAVSADPLRVGAAVFGRRI